MTREAYHNALKGLEGELLSMGDMVANAINSSVEALQKRDIETSKKIVENDVLVNKKRFGIEEKCLLLIATQQPMAVDLRTIAAILSIITDLERMADHAEGIARINVMIDKSPLVKQLVDLPRMAEKGLLMLNKCLKAFIDRNVDDARAVCNEDDEVDALYDRVYRDLLLLMIENPNIIEGATYLIWVAHNLERIADRITNIAERVVFMVTGRMDEINVSKY